MATLDTVRKIALALPGMEEGTSYGTPGFRTSGKFVARMWEDGETLVLKIGFEERDMLLQSQPDVYFNTDHYRSYPSVLVHLPLIDDDELKDIIEQAWRKAATKRALLQYDRNA